MQMPKSKTLYLVRHCTATGQEADAPLSETGFAQAQTLAEWLRDKNIEAIVCSPFTRACQSILPFSQQQDIPLETDARLVERVLRAEPRPDWQQLLKATFEDMDLCLSGGETSRDATRRAVAVVEEILLRTEQTTVLVSHGNLLTLLLKHFDSSVGFAHWQRMTNPDVFRLTFSANNLPTVQRVWS